jgi:hypothetical protein
LEEWRLFLGSFNNWCIWSILWTRYISYSINLKNESLFIYETRGSISLT